MLDQIRSGRKRWPGIIGYDRTVLPQLENAILSKHDVLLLGLRGQAKTRILRQLVNFLDEFVPIIKGSALNEDPLQPITKASKELVAQVR